MGILSYLIVLRIKRIFNLKAHPIKTIGIVLFLIVAILYGLLFALLFNLPEIQGKVLSLSELKQYLIFSIVIITILRGFFPIYIPIKSIITKNYPLNKIERFLYNLANEFVYPFYFGIVLFVVAFSVQIDGGGIEFLVIASLWIVISHLLRRLLQFFIEFRFGGINFFPILLATTIFIISYFVIFIEKVAYSEYLLSLSATIILLQINYLFENKSKEQKVIALKGIKRSDQNVNYIKLLLNNNSLRTMLFIALLMKVLFAFTYGNILMKQREYFAVFEFLFNFILSPVFLFTYLFNNFFGFSKSLWLSMNKAGANVFSYYAQILKVLTVPLIIDMAITIIYHFFYASLNYVNIVTYLNCVFFMFIISVISSFYLPKKVESLFSMRPNVSFGSGLLSMACISIIILITKFSPLVGILVSVSSVFSIYFLTRDKILKTRYKLFRTLFT